MRKKNMIKKSVIKKCAAIFMGISMIAGLAGCGTNSAGSAGTASTEKNGKLSIVTTIFPEYDWVREIAGMSQDSADKSPADGIDLTMLLDNGVDLHSFQPTAADIARISTCDMFIYVGGESDKWVDDALKEATNKDMIVIDLLEVLGDSVKEEEIVEGMEAEEDEDHDHEESEEHEDSDHEDSEHEDGDHEDSEHEDGDHDEEHEGEGHHHEAGEIEYDEHIWLSIKDTQVLTNLIADKLCEKDSKNAAAYKANVEAYNKKLAGLDSEYQSAVDNAPVKTLIFGDRFPFRYMTDDYGLDYYAAFVGCSAETEASFETVIFLAGKVDEVKAPAICTIESSDGKIAETVRENTESKDQEIIKLNSLQSVTSKDIEGGVTYYSIMEENLNTMKKALGY